MQYISTRDTNAAAISASEAIRRGIAPDGGLYVPENFPAYLPERWDGLDYRTLAREIFALYLTDFSAREIDRCVTDAYGGNFPPEVVPCVSVGNAEVLELFHGPTAAFKDVALQALPRLLTLSMEKSGDGKRAVVLTATSGDTGKAALEGFRGVTGVEIIVFYPKDGVSLVQERQMVSTTGSNVRVVGVDGNFDDCQNGVKKLFADAELRREMSAAGLAFSSANSINFGRLLPQIVYYYHGYGKMAQKGRIRDREEIQIVVPSGNFGNLLAAYYAKRMGLPVARLLCASNINDVLTETINTGRYNRRRGFHKTTSPSMDILVSSNFERFLFEMYGRDAARCTTDLKALSEDGEFTVPASAREAWGEFLSAGSADEDEVRETIKRVFETDGYLLDPHTAVGWRVFEKRGAVMPTLIAATASPYKFTESVLEALAYPAENMSEGERQAALSKLSGTPTPQSLAGIENRPVLHNLSVTQEGMKAIVKQIPAG